MTEQQPARKHGREALQELVDAKRKLNELQRWQVRVNTLRQEIDAAASTLDWQYRQSLAALEVALSNAPEELDGRVSEHAQQWLDAAGDKVTAVERQVADVLARMAGEP